MPLPDAFRQIARDLWAPRQLAGAIETVLLLLVIATAAWIILRLSLALIRRTGARVYGYPGQTLTPVLENAVRYLIGFTALIVMLQTVHVNITGVLASAGVVGVALGFGAQYLVRDILAGMFLLSEGIVQIGDTVRIGADTGTVEHITLRITQIRKFSGELVTIPNGAIDRLGNLSRGYGRAVVQVTVPYRTDVAAALQALEEAARAWAAANPSDAQGEPQVDGTIDFKDTGAVLQVSVRVSPGRQAAAEADLRRRTLDALAGRGIRIDTRLSATI